MKLIDFQKMLTPHTVVMLCAWPKYPAMGLWFGYIEACDFGIFGSNNVVFLELIDKGLFPVLCIYLELRG